VSPGNRGGAVKNPEAICSAKEMDLFEEEQE